MSKNTQQAEAERKAAIEQHATFGGDKGPTAGQSLANLRAALATEVAKPLHRQQRPVIENLRERIKAAERNAAAAT